MATDKSNKLQQLQKHIKRYQLNSMLRVTRQKGQDIGDLRSKGFQFSMENQNLMTNQVAKVRLILRGALL